MDESGCDMDEPSFAEADVEYLIDVLEQGNRFGVIKEGSFKALSNFRIDINMEVRDAGLLSGFICSVTFYDGTELGDAFYPNSWSRGGRRAWMSSLWDSLKNTNLSCHATTSQIDAYLMRKLEDFYRLKMESIDTESSQHVKKAATAVGLQNPSDADKVWVLNGKVHLNEDGELLDTRQSPYIWLADYVPEAQLRQQGIPENSAASTVQPHRKSTKYLSKLIGALEKVYGDNFSAAVTLLGAGVLALHYEAINDDGSKVPAAIACGNVSLGKSAATEAALAPMGAHKCNKVKSITDSHAMKAACRTTLGLVIDDPTKACEIAEKLLYHFEQGVRATNTARDTPRTTFICSMNFTCLQELANMDARYITRAVIIPFVDSRNLPAAERIDVDRTLQCAVHKAGRAAGTMIALGNCLTGPEAQQELKEIVKQVESYLPNLQCHRLIVSYSWLLLATFKVLYAAKRLTDSMEEHIWGYFRQTMVPCITEYQMQCTQQLTKEDIEAILIQGVNGVELSKVLTFLRTDRKLKREDGVPTLYYALLLPEFVKHLGEIGVSLPARFQSALSSSYKGHMREGVLQLFLAPG